MTNLIRIALHIRSDGLCRADAKPSLEFAASDAQLGRGVDVSPVGNPSGGVREMKCAGGEPAADAYHGVASPSHAKKPPGDAGLAAKEWVSYRVRYELEEEVGGASPGCPLGIFCE